MDNFIVNTIDSITEALGAWAFGNLSYGDSNENGKKVASLAGIFRGARFSSLPTNACSAEDNMPFPCLTNHIVRSKFWKTDLDRKVIS